MQEEEDMEVEEEIVKNSEKLTSSRAFSSFLVCLKKVLFTQ